MPSDSRGHHADPPRNEPIDQQLLARIQRLIPPAWFAWAKHCMALRAQYGVPETLPHKMGTIQTRIGTVTVWLVDGNAAMLYDMDFTEGANHEEDPVLCPPGTIFLDANLLFPVPEDLIANAYHEAVEQDMMALDGLKYDQAHVRANAAEKAIRQQVAPVDTQV